MVFGEYENYCLFFFDITLNFLEKNMYANLLTRCDDACVITPYLFIYLFIIMTTIDKFNICSGPEKFYIQHNLSL